MRKIISALALLLLLVLSGCSSKGVKLFSQELCDGITEVRYMDFQGNETVYSDEDTINLMADALQAGTYEMIDDEYMVTGLYGFTFVSNGQEYSIGYAGNNIIQYDWHQYIVHNNKFHKLLSLTGESVFIPAVPVTVGLSAVVLLFFLYVMLRKRHSVKGNT